MTAATKTKALKRVDLALEVLVPNEDNPNKMANREFDLLVDNISKVGFTDPVLVRTRSDGKYDVIGGHHRLMAAQFLGFTEVPCTVIDDPEFDKEAADMQLVRHNVIHGKLDPAKFIELYKRYEDKYSTDILQEMMGFAEEADFRRLIEKTVKTLPKEMQQAFKDAAGEVKTIEGLSNLLNALFAKYGDTLPFGYMVFEYGGQSSIWLRVEKKTLESLRLIGQICIEKERTMDDVVGHLLRAAANGDLSDAIDAAISSSSPVKIPQNFKLDPTKDNIQKAAQASV